MKIPYSLKTYEKLMKEWTAAINRNECISVLGLERSSQLSRLEEFMSNTSFLENHVRDYKKCAFFVFDLETEFVKDEGGLNEWLRKHELKGLKNIIFVLSSDLLIDQKCTLLPVFEKILRKGQSLFIFFFHHNILSPKYLQIMGQHHIFFQNIQIFPLFSFHDRLLFISYLEKVFTITIPKEEKERIAKLCGGSMWFIKEAVRQYSKNPIPNQTYRHEAMNTKLRIFYEDFSPEEKNILQDISLGKKPGSSESLNYLTALGLIEKKRNSYLITIPIFNDYVHNLTRSNHILSLDKDNIIQNGMNITSFFSKRERELLIYFIKNQNKLISRDQCAEIIWKNNSDGLYSDWALDQSIRRLRKKLLKLNLPKNILVSKRRKGYYLRQESA